MSAWNHTHVVQSVDCAVAIYRVKRSRCGVGSWTFGCQFDSITFVRVIGRGADCRMKFGSCIEAILLFAGHYSVCRFGGRLNGVLVRTALCACVVIAFGCGGSDPGEEPDAPSEPRVVEHVIDVAGFYELAHADMPRARIGNQYRHVLVKPYSVEDQAVMLSADGIVDLTGVIDESQISPSAEGLIIALRQGEFAYFDFRPATDLRVALPDGFKAALTPGLPVSVHVREQVPLSDVRSSWFKTTSPVQLELGVALDVAMTSEPAKVHMTVTVETVDAEEVIFDRVLTELLREDDDHTWSDVSIDLARFQGEPFRLLFHAERIADPSGAPNTASVMWGNPIIQMASAVAPPERPNVILISLDTLRADHLGAYGYERDTSPNLDRLFEEGVLFENCVSTSSWTTPAHASVFTGLSPVIHRANGLNGYRLRDRFTTLAELAESSGQLTAAFTEGVAVGGQLGFYQGFDVYSNGPSAHPTPPGSAGKTFGAATEWLDRYGHQPFFMFVHTYEIHALYRAPKPYGKMYVADEMKGEPQFVPLVPQILAGMDISEDKKKMIVDTYDGEIRYTDHIVGEFMDDLRARGLLDNTLVVIFSDHGEEFWEHGSMIHGLTLFNEQLHVPLFIRFPGSDGPTGRVSQMVSSCDVFSTVNDYLGYGAGPKVDSLSLLPLCDPKTYTAPYVRDIATSQLLQRQLSWLLVAAQTPEHKYIVTTDWDNVNSALTPLLETYEDESTAFLERMLLKHVLEGGRDTSNASSDEEIRSILQSANERLFDLAADRSEADDLVNTSPELLQQMRERLARRLEELADASPTGVMESVSPLDEREREELKALGYVD